MSSSTPTPIAGVHPADTREATVATVWPSIAAGPWGRWLGQLYDLRAGVRIGGVPLTIGWALVVLTMPLAALLYLGRKAPRKPFVFFGARNPDGVCYRITNRRITVIGPLERNATADAQIAHDAYDKIRIEVLPGQEWFRAGDVLFLAGEEEQLRLPGVPRPEPFVELCRKTQLAAEIGSATAIAMHAS